jgi:DNA-binding IclR family transcriptional regulator
MSGMDTKELLNTLNRRRHELDMPISAVSRRSGVHPSTVNRLFVGDLSVAGFMTVCRVARALGVEVVVRQVSVLAMKRQAARLAAAKIVKSVQGTSALEAQAVDPQTLKLIEGQIMTQLLAGPGYRLWAK